jgi:superoxide dismutase, Fe-Mn family
MMTRRQAIKTTALATAACAAALPLANAQTTTTANTSIGDTLSPFKLPPLPYAYDALEPHIDAKTMEIHHDKHHAAYIANLNKALTGHDNLQSQSLEGLLMNPKSLPESIRMSVQNNCGGHYNHSLFWQMMSKGGGGEPKGALASAIDKSFKNFSSFKEEFSKAATTRFGSGWAWLVMDGSKTLTVESTPNQDTLLPMSKNVLLGVDVWEHAYYLKYQNRRPEYVAAFFNVINWDFVADRFNKLSA